MTDTKLITLLKALSPEEFKEFEKFVSSPYFAKGRNFIPLLSALKRFYPEFKNSKLTKETLFKKIYPNDKYSPQSSDHKIKILFSGLYKLSMDFFAQLGLKNDSARRNYYILNQLRLKKLDNDYQKLYTEAFNGSELHKGSIFDFINKFYLSDLNKSYSMAHHDYKSTFESSIAMREYIVISSLISCFKHEPEKTVMSRYNIEIKNSLVNNVLENLNIDGLLAGMKESGDRFYPYVLVYYTIYKMETDPDNVQHFFQLKKLIREFQSSYGRTERFAHYIIMETYCQARKRIICDPVFERELFNLYNEMLNDNLYKVSENESFNVVLFRNMVLTSSGLLEYDWLENFINKYSSELRTSNRDALKNYSLAVLCFGKKNFDYALEYLSKIKFELFLYKIDVKILLLKIYYEKGYYEQVYSTIDTTMHYLKNTTDLSDSHKESVRKFFKYMKELVKLKSNGKAAGKNEINFIKSRIENEEFFNNREWVLLKLKEL